MENNSLTLKVSYDDYLKLCVALIDAICRYESYMCICEEVDDEMYQEYRDKYKSFADVLKRIKEYVVKNY